MRAVFGSPDVMCAATTQQSLREALVCTLRVAGTVTAPGPCALRGLQPDWAGALASQIFYSTRVRSYSSVYSAYCLLGSGGGLGQELMLGVSPYYR